MPRLDLYNGNELLLQLNLEDDEVTIGRNIECTVQLPDPSVSRLHAIITQSEGRVVIEDRSTNGTRVNGQRVDQRRELTPGDSITVGPFRIAFQSDEPVRDGGAQTVRGQKSLA